MPTFRVPVHFAEDPVTDETRTFRDRPDFIEEVSDKLGAFGRMGPADRFTGSSVIPVDDLTYNIYVDILDPSLIGLPNQPVEAAQRIVINALVELGYTIEAATIDPAEIVELAHQQDL